MAIIYAVTSGDYSDYTVHGVFSSREKATMFIKIWNKSSKARHRFNLRSKSNITKWKLDVAIDALLSEVNKLPSPSKREPKLILWSVILSTTTGDVRKCHKSEVQKGCPDDNSVAENIDLNNNVYQTYVWARSGEHAIKIANERRAQYIAERPLKSMSSNETL